MKKWRLETFMNKNGTAILFSLFAGMILMIAYVQIKYVEYPKKAPPVIIKENENRSTVNLSVVNKGSSPISVPGFFPEYYLLLSNDMIIYVTRKDFDKYEMNQAYDFDLIETTTVSQTMRICKDDD